MDCQRPIVCFNLKQNQNKQVESADLILKVDSDNIWQWQFRLNNFGAVHGILRVVKLLPDKLSTSIAINNENLSNSQDNGSFLIDLVLDLLLFYRECCCPDSLEDESKISFTSTLSKLSSFLRMVKAALQQRDVEKIEFFLVPQILSLCTNILIMCYTCLDFVHPLFEEWNKNSLKPEFQTIADLKSKLKTKLLIVKTQLFEEFQQYR